MGRGPVQEFRSGSDRNLVMMSLRAEDRCKKIDWLFTVGGRKDLWSLQRLYVFQLMVGTGADEELSWCDLLAHLGLALINNYRNMHAANEAQ